MKCTVLECLNEVTENDMKVLPDSTERICIDCLATRKMCGVCGQILLLSEFSSNPDHKDGLQNWCRSCHSLKFDFRYIAFIRKGFPHILDSGKSITHDNEFAKTEAEMRDYCKTCHCVFCNQTRLWESHQERSINELGTL